MQTAVHPPNKNSSPKNRLVVLFTCFKFLSNSCYVEEILLIPFHPTAKLFFIRTVLYVFTVNLLSILNLLMYCGIPLFSLYVFFSL